MHFIAKKGVTAPWKREWKEASLRGGMERSQREKPSSVRSWYEVKGVKEEEEEEVVRWERDEVSRKDVWRRGRGEDVVATRTREEAGTDPYKAVREGRIEDRTIDRGGVGGVEGVGGGNSVLLLPASADCSADCDKDWERGLRNA